jgi:hypothetical protein
MSGTVQGEKPQTIFGTMTAMRSPHDVEDRDSQARSLAAAGMVADRVGMSQPAALQPPPVLALKTSPSRSQPPSTNEIDSNLNWNLMDSGMHLDDLDLDFATLFDPVHEQAHMQIVESNGWQGADDLVMALSPNRLGSQLDGNKVE